MIGEQFYIMPRMTGFVNELGTGLTTTRSVWTPGAPQHGLRSPLPDHYLIPIPVYHTFSPCQATTPKKVLPNPLYYYRVFLTPNLTTFDVGQTFVKHYVYRVNPHSGLSVRGPVVAYFTPNSISTLPASVRRRRWSPPSLH